jgi:hypothetical protein
VPQFFSQKELARRWGVSPRTLEYWRWQHKGPAFIKLGGQVRYTLEDVAEFERNCIRRVMAGSNDVVRKAA